MKNFEDMWKEFIIDPLKAVSIVNEYENDLCFLNGWLIHYALDIARGVNGWSFPAVGAHPEDEEIVIQPRGGQYEPMNFKNIREFQIDIAIDVVTDREGLLARMESALRDVKKAIATVNTRNVTLNRAKFELPEDSEQYAFIIVSGKIMYNEVF
jgi:hypothetical protein